MNYVIAGYLWPHVVFCREDWCSQVKRDLGLTDSPPENTGMLRRLFERLGFFEPLKTDQRMCGVGGMMIFFPPLTPRREVQNVPDTESSKRLPSWKQEEQELIEVTIGQSETLERNEIAMTLERLAIRLREASFGEPSRTISRDAFRSGHRQDCDILRESQVACEENPMVIGESVFTERQN